MTHSLLFSWQRKHSSVRYIVFNCFLIGRKRQEIVRIKPGPSAPESGTQPIEGTQQQTFIGDLVSKETVRCVGGKVKH